MIDTKIPLHERLRPLEHGRDWPTIEGPGAQELVDAIGEAAELLRHVARPIPMLLWCTLCGERHIDKGEFATKPHHTHACQHCGMVWRPAIVPTCGVRFLPGFKNDEPVAAGALGTRGGAT